MPGLQAQATVLAYFYLGACHYGMSHIHVTLNCSCHLAWHPVLGPSQLNYADMLKRVEPLRNELQKLEDDAKDNQQKANEVEQMIRDLEASIARYKEEYAVLISEAQAIKADLAAVEAKVSLPATHSHLDIVLTASLGGAKINSIGSHILVRQ